MYYRFLSTEELLVGDLTKENLKELWENRDKWRMPNRKQPGNLRKRPEVQSRFRTAAGQRNLWKQPEIRSQICIQD